MLLQNKTQNGDKMTKDVLISIRGFQIVDDDDDAQPVELIAPGQYYCRNGKHYVLYDEVDEDDGSITKNRIKIQDDYVGITKKGVSNTNMIFEKNKKNQTFYKTPYGQMLIGVNTRHLQVDFEEDKIAVQIDYELDVNHEPMADCKIRMNIVSKDSGKFSVLS